MRGEVGASSLAPAHEGGAVPDLRMRECPPSVDATCMKFLTGRCVRPQPCNEMLRWVIQSARHRTLDAEPGWMAKWLPVACESMLESPLWRHRLAMCAAAIVAAIAGMWVEAGLAHGARSSSPSFFDLQVATLAGVFLGGVFALACLAAFPFVPPIPRAPNEIVVLVGAVGGLVFCWMFVALPGKERLGISGVLCLGVLLGLLAPATACFAGRLIERAWPRPSGVCKSCGYQIAGASTCPECGTVAD